MVITLVVLLGAVGLVVDVGRAYLAQRQLQQAVDAAALAAGQTLPDSTLAREMAVDYSATGKNAHLASMTAADATVTFKCLQTLVNRNIPCQVDPTPGSPCATTGCNAVQVTQRAKVGTLFARVFLPSFTVSARSTVGMRGGAARPLDIMVALDRTSSMDLGCGVAVKDPDGDVVIPGNKAKKIDCAKDGVRQLLKGLLPCDPNANDICGTAAPLDQVGLIVFPPLKAKDATTHDPGNPAHSNLNLETSASCSGEFDSQPDWYQPPNAWGQSKWMIREADVGYNSAGVNERQTVLYEPTVSDSFPLTFEGQTTGPIAFGATAAVLRAELESLSTIGSGNVGVSRADSGTGFLYTITFVGALGSQDVAKLSSSSPDVTIATTVPGSSGFDLDYAFAPLSNDFRTSEAPGLNPSSRLVQAITWASCQGLAGQGSGTTTDGFASETAQGYPGNRYYGINARGETYHTGAILAAQSALAAAAAQHPDRRAQRVIILLSDGEATTGDEQPCAGAISAAQDAAEAGTWVYSIAYKLNGATKCTKAGGDPEAPEITGYFAMAQIARNSDSPTVPDPTKFFCPGTTNQDPDLPCQDGDTLTEVFQSIGVSLTAPRIYPDDTE